MHLYTESKLLFSRVFSKFEISLPITIMFCQSKPAEMQLSMKFGECKFFLHVPFILFRVRQQNSVSNLPNNDSWCIVEKSNIFSALLMMIMFPVLVLFNPIEITYGFEKKTNLSSLLKELWSFGFFIDEFSDGMLWNMLQIMQKIRIWCL